MVSPYDFEYPLGILSSDKSQQGTESYIHSVINRRMEADPDIYKKIIVGEKYAGLMISIATVLLVIIFIYAIYAKENADEKIMIYSSIAAIGLLVASGVTI